MDGACQATLNKFCRVTEAVASKRHRLERILFIALIYL